MANQAIPEAADQAATRVANRPEISDAGSVTGVTQIESRLVAAVERRLGIAVRFLRWTLHARTGASIPVFAVPADALKAARALGLTVEVA